MFELTILSIFRESSSYLPRYFSQLEEAFRLRGGVCHAIWLEGDSQDDTYSLLESKKKQLELEGHSVTLVKHDLNGPFLPSINCINRWMQLATCWNKCLEQLRPSKFTVCVESDLIWESSIIEKTIPQLDSTHHVICPMLMVDESFKLFGVEHFYDLWGFSRSEKKFYFLPPYWSKDSLLIEEEALLQVTTGGGMIVSTYDVQKK